MTAAISRFTLLPARNLSWGWWSVQIEPLYLELPRLSPVTRFAESPRAAGAGVVFRWASPIRSHNLPIRLRWTTLRRRLCQLHYCSLDLHVAVACRRATLRPIATWARHL